MRGREEQTNERTSDTEWMREKGKEERDERSGMWNLFWSFPFLKYFFLLFTETPSMTDYSLSKDEAPARWVELAAYLPVNCLLCLFNTRTSTKVNWMAHLPLWWLSLVCQECVLCPIRHIALCPLPCRRTHPKIRPHSHYPLSFPFSYSLTLCLVRSLSVRVSVLIDSWIIDYSSPCLWFFLNEPHHHLKGQGAQGPFPSFYHSAIGHNQREWSLFAWPQPFSLRFST